MIAFQEGLIKVDSFQIIIEGRLSMLDFQIEERPYRLISIYAPAEPETRNSVDFFKKLFTTDILDPSKTNILAGDWNCGLHQSDHHGYKDWESYRPRTRRIIKNACIEHQLTDPFKELHRKHSATETKGYTFQGREIEGREIPRSRIDYFLISSSLYDYVQQADIVEEEIPLTDHKMITMEINFL